MLQARQDTAARKPDEKLFCLLGRELSVWLLVSERRLKGKHMEKPAAPMRGGSSQAVLPDN